MVDNTLDLSTTRIPLDCPQCGAKNTFTLGQVARGEGIVCAGCGLDIKLVDNGSVNRAQQKVNSSIEELKRTIKNVNSRLRRKG